MPFYFAYGSCMNVPDLLRSGVGAIQQGTVVLKNYRLTFSRYSYSRGGGVADIVKQRGEFVEGILYWVPNLTALDVREGAPYVYRRKRVRVHLTDGGEPMTVWTYEVVDKAMIEYAPSRHYALLIWEGARILSPAYREKLKQILLREERVKNDEQSRFGKASFRKDGSIEERSYEGRRGCI